MHIARTTDMLADPIQRYGSDATRLLLLVARAGRLDDPASDVTGRPVGPEDWTGHRRDALAGLVRAVLR
jgi:hypothetical protein